MKLMPFFTYYGGKNRAARLYPRPRFDTIIEPFAGSAGYSMNYPHHEVLLFDLDPVIVGTWQYLIGVSQEEILALPDLEPGQTTDDLDLSQEARWLIGWWLAKGVSAPYKRPSTWVARYPQGGPFWGERVRQRIAGQLPHIRHWRVKHASYEEAPCLGGTWFIDPPYADKGHRYRFGSKSVDYPALADWCRSRPGQVIVCEADDANWLPFRDLALVDGTEGRQKTSRARLEKIWTNG